MNPLSPIYWIRVNRERSRVASDAVRGRVPQSYSSSTLHHNTCTSGGGRDRSTHAHAGSRPRRTHSRDHDATRTNIYSHPSKHSRCTRAPRPRAGGKCGRRMTDGQPSAERGDRLRTPTRRLPGPVDRIARCISRTRPRISTIRPQAQQEVHNSHLVAPPRSVRSVGAVCVAAAHRIIRI